MSLLDWNTIPHDLCNFKMHLRIGGDCLNSSSHDIRNHSEDLFIHVFIFCCLLAAVARAPGDSRLTRTAKLENLPNADVHAFFKFFSHVYFFSIKAASHAMTVCTFIGCFFCCFAPVFFFLLETAQRPLLANIAICYSPTSLHLWPLRPIFSSVVAFWRKHFTVLRQTEN